MVDTVAKTGRDIIRIAEDFESRVRPPAPVPVFTTPNAVPVIPVVPVPVTPTPKRLPTPEELFGIQPTTTASTSPAPIQGGVVNGRTVLPMPVRRRGVSIDRK